MSLVSHLRTVLLGALLAVLTIFFLVEPRPAFSREKGPGTGCVSCTCKHVKGYMYKTETTSNIHWFYLKNQDGDYVPTNSALVGLLSSGDCDSKTFRVETTTSAVSQTTASQVFRIARFSAISTTPTRSCWT